MPAGLRVYTAPRNHSGEGHARGDPCMDHLSHRTPPMTSAPTGRRAIEVPESATLRESADSGTSMALRPVGAEVMGGVRCERWSIHGSPRACPSPEWFRGAV